MGLKKNLKKTLNSALLFSKYLKWPYSKTTFKIQLYQYSSRKPTSLAYTVVEYDIVLKLGYYKNNNNNNNNKK